MAVAEEVPIAIVYDQEPHAVLMGTPLDLEDLAVGFSLTEDVIRCAEDLRAIDVVRHSRGIELKIQLDPGAMTATRLRARRMSSRTGCGLCGVEALDDALRTPCPVSSGATYELATIWQASREFERHQTLNAGTRTVHGACWVDAEGVIQIVREDVGRHNALDKVIGALARSATPAESGFFVVSSRASFEMVQKTAVAGVPLLAAVSRPTGLAIDLADSLGLTLVGLLRGESALLYTHPERIVMGPAAPPAASATP
ncbi:MAG: formate dehydrogenase accessory sulfurtransferase FdhD [Planctomycetota bacterium]